MTETASKRSRQFPEATCDHAAGRAAHGGGISARERLLAEELPTGTFGGRTQTQAALTPERAAANRAALEEAISRRRQPRKTVRHLHLVPGTTHTGRPAA